MWRELRGKARQNAAQFRRTGAVFCLGVKDHKTFHFQF